MPGSSLQDFLSSGQVPPNSIWLSKISNFCPQQHHTPPPFGQQCFHRYFPAIQLHCTLVSLSFPDKWGLYTSASFWEPFICGVSVRTLVINSPLATDYIRSSACPWSLPKPWTASGHTQDTKTRSTRDILTCLLMWSICRSVEQSAVLRFVSLMVPVSYLPWHLRICNCLRV